MTAAMLCASILPWRSAYWAVGGLGSPDSEARLGTMALSPNAHKLSWPETRMNSSTTILPRSFFTSRPASTGGGALPTATISVRVEILVPP
jgi:hypothetical protein